MQRKVVFTIVALAVIGIAGTAAAASLVAPQQGAVAIHSAFASHVADSIVPHDEQVPYTPAPTPHRSGCGGHWWN